MVALGPASAGACHHITSVHMCMCVYTQRLLLMWPVVCMYVCVCVCVYTQRLLLMWPVVCMYVCMYVCVYVYMCIVRAGVEGRGYVGLHSSTDGTHVQGPVQFTRGLVVVAVVYVVRVRVRRPPVHIWFGRRQTPCLSPHTHTNTRTHIHIVACIRTHTHTPIHACTH